ncbi:FUSC family protein [Roseicella frigidaeris]|uniref:FUSC family protein n=1 Tax=Roseicella frigidaeris TaxID=2230885 RepID=A0A327MF91_9PROT|nr:FUSC family protein [Roseicella frigidaeris]RAI60942.1 FUSC family protein [Roseicella frigidaeris]
MSAAPGPSLADVVFSLKTFAAAMLAYWIALYFDLSRPFWAVGTVYIIAHPLAGAITSKAVYRLLGTLIGGVMTVLLVPNLVNAPEWLTLAIALWVGLCVFVSLLDRTPRGYVFLLGGYTVLLAGLPLVNSPEAAFDTAVARVEEIGLGILCGALVSRTILPRHAGPVLLARVDAWLGHAARLAGDALLGEARPGDAQRERRRLAADAVDMRAFTTHVGYDTSRHQARTDLLHGLQERMILLLPLVSAIEDHVAGLRRAGALAAPAAAALREVAAWMAADGATAAARVRLLERIAALEATAPPGWEGLLLRNLALRLRELVALWRDCRALRADLATGAARRARTRRLLAAGGGADRHLDYGMAALSGLGATLAILLGSVFWIATGWADGVTVPQIAGVFCCLLAAMDDPVPAMRQFMLFVLAAAAIAFAYQFAVFPMLDGFLPLAAALGLTLIPAGILLATPARYLIGMGLCVNIPFMLTLQSRLSLDAAGFLNANIALVLAIALAMLTSALVRSVGAEASARRLLHRGWARIAAAAARPRPGDPGRIQRQLIDTLGLLAPRLAALGAGSQAMAGDLLRDLRVGLDIAALKAVQPALPGPAAARLAALLARLGAYYRDGKATADAGLAELVAGIDACLALTAALPGPAALGAGIALAGLRQALDPGAPAPRPVAALAEKHAA